MLAHRIMTGGASSQLPFSYEDLGSDFSDTDTDTWSFTSFPIGTDDTVERIVYLMILTEIDTGGTVDSATVDGVSTSLVLNAQYNGASNAIVNIRKAVIPASSGTTGTVVVNTSTPTNYRLAIYGYAAYNATGEDTGGGTTGTNPSFTMDVTEGGVSFCGFASINEVASVTWGGDLVQQYVDPSGNAEFRVGAEEGVATTASGKSHSVTQSDAASVFAGVSFW